VPQLVPAGHAERPRRGFYFLLVSKNLAEPSPIRAITFVDGQNLYRCAKDAFGCSHPNYDVLKLARAVCTQHQWALSEARFYTGIPPAGQVFWHRFWQRKLLAISRQGVRTFSRQLRNGREKGIDVRIAIDIITLAYRRAFDVAVVFSQDQDFSEIASEIRKISREQGRWIKMASAFPDQGANSRGINNTQWCRIDQQLYNSCIDPHDYRT